MIRKKLNSEEIIVPGEFELGNESILKMYYRVFEKGHGNCLPPVLVTKFKKFDFKNLENWLEDCFRHWEKPELKGMLHSGTLEARRKDYRNLFEVLKNSYALLDGNHKSAAATLAHRSIQALEIESDQDLIDIRTMVEKGELFDFKREETSLCYLKKEFVAYLLNLNVRESDGNITFSNTSCSTLKYLGNIKQRIEQLVSDGELPQYMVDRYFKDRNNF